MPLETDTYDIDGGSRGPLATGSGLVTLFTPDPRATPPAFALSAGALVLGRDPPPGGVLLPFTSVSRVHTRFGFDGAAHTVEDLESRNGTFVNGERITRTVVEDGDELRVGEALFKVVLSGIEEYAAFSLAGEAPAPPMTALRGGLLIERIRREIAKIARADLSVLVVGETGTGKELVAQALHDASGRSGPFAAVNCAAIPAALLESELFGYKRGAFTGADRDRVGLVKSANGGTLFLDEIGDMSLESQAKVLRIIETRLVTPLGSHVGEPVDLRIVCATHRPLTRLVAAASFRADLYARVSGHTIALPPLRDRKEDIYQLARLFLERGGGAHLHPTSAFMLGLLAHDWPFNVRELESAIKRAIALAEAGTIDESHLPAAVVDGVVDASERAAAPATSERARPPSEAELRAVLERHGGNVAAVARELGKDRVQIHRWLTRYKLSLAEFRGG